MLVLVIYGMPNIPPGGAAADQVLFDLAISLQLAVADVLVIKADCVSVFFPSDMLRRGLGEELICFVGGLF